MSNISRTIGLIALSAATTMAVSSATPLHAQDAVEDAIEAVAEAAAEAAQVAADTSDYPRRPMLIDFTTLQANPNDYPTASWVAGEEGTVYYSLAVDALGNVADCSIIDSSGFDRLDAKTCEIALERARFEPALDQNSNPVAGEHRDYQVWTKREPAFPGTSKIRVAFTVTETGEIVDCNPIEASGVIGDRMRQTLEQEPCPGSNRTNNAPFRDEEGNPIAKRVNLTIDVNVSDLEE